MEKINFENLPSENTPINQDNLNLMQSNIEKSVVAVGETQPSTSENVWIKKGKNLIDASKIMFGTVGHGNGNYSYITYAAVTDFIPVQAGDYHLKLFSPGTGSNRILVFRVAGYDENKNYLWDDSDLDTTDRTISGSSTRYLRICFAIYGYQTISSLDTIKNSQPQLEVGTSATTYEAYINKKIGIKNNNAVFEEFYSENNKEQIFETELEDVNNYFSSIDVNRVLRVGDLVTINFRGLLQKNVADNQSFLKSPYETRIGSSFASVLYTGNRYTARNSHWFYIGSGYIQGEALTSGNYVHISISYIAK